MTHKAIVLDANILIRAVLGTRVRTLILENAQHTQFFAPDVAYEDARKYLPALLTKRGIPSEPAMAVLNELELLVRSVDSAIYDELKASALARIATRDADDWPVLATAMTLSCPIWTEDQDFFGTGVATWTSDRVGLYLKL
jgi:predicted nucleic acid-binding protein